MRRWLVLLVVLKALKTLVVLLVLGGMVWGCSRNLDSSPFKGGFLSQSEAPDMVAILPLPPADGSAELEEDKKEYQRGKTLRSTPRGELAIADTHNDTKSLLKGFSPAFGYELSLKNTPEIYGLIDGIRSDSQKYSAKDYYKRLRPFAFYNEQTCNPKEEKFLNKERSYPSEDASLGRAVALVLSQVNPNNEEALLQRGYEYGQSRIICGVHWASDVDAGEIAGRALIFAEKKNPQYQAQLQKAREEFSRLSGVEPEAQLNKAEEDVSRLSGLEGQPQAQEEAMLAAQQPQLAA